MLLFVGLGHTKQKQSNNIRSTLQTTCDAGPTYRTTTTYYVHIHGIEHTVGCIVIRAGIISGCTMMYTPNQTKQQQKPVLGRFFIFPLFLVDSCCVMQQHLRCCSTHIQFFMLCSYMNLSLYLCFVLSLYIITMLPSFAYLRATMCCMYAHLKSKRNNRWFHLSPHGRSNEHTTGGSVRKYNANVTKSTESRQCNHNLSMNKAMCETFSAQLADLCIFFLLEIH